MGTEPTALERHAAYFDPKGTGFITFSQTVDGLRRVGVPWHLRVVLATIINAMLGYVTEGKPSTVIRVDKIAQGKHPYDSGTFDRGGQIDASAFDALFAGAEDALTADEMHAIISARGNQMTDRGAVAGALGKWFTVREVNLFFCVAADTAKVVGGKKVPAVHKTTMRKFYEGKLLPELARRRVLVEAGCVRRRPIG
ncbi:MAG TPA: caleosin family protein [Polyangiaceae bacterium]|jgi:hypothetical protein|nr:caleosin family protein [Polyangiaceae bacterium]